MKRLRKFIICIFILTLFLIASFFLKPQKTYASSTWEGFMGTFGTYSKAMSKTPSWFYKKTLVYESGVGYYWQNKPNILCFEHSNVGGGGNGSRPYLIVDINSDGTDPGKIEVYYNGKKKVADYNGGKAARRMAYIAYAASVEPSHANSLSWSWKATVVHEWLYKFSGTVKSALNSVNCKISWPSHNEPTSELSNVNAAAESYANNWQNRSKWYRARVMIMCGGGQQSRGVVWGKLDSRNDVRIKKYIRKVEAVDRELADLGDQKLYKKDKWTRKDYTETKKKKSPVTTKVSEVKITYQITVTNKDKTKAHKGVLKDVFQTKYLKDLEWIEVPSGVKVNKDKNQTGTFTIPKGESVSFKVTLTGKPGVLTGTYKNTATFTDSEYKYSVSSSDYIKVNSIEKFNISKFITRIEDLNEPTIGDDTLDGDTSLEDEDGDLDIKDDDTGDLEDGEQDADTGDIGDLNNEGLEEINQKFGETRNKSEAWKKKNPALTPSGNVKIYYTIRIRNKGTGTLKGKLKDTFNKKFLKDITWVKTNNVKITKTNSTSSTTAEFTIKPNKYKDFKITLIGKKEIMSGKYENTATFTSTTNKIKNKKKRSKSSTDWIELGSKDLKINKYISEFDEKLQDRADYDEETKANKPVVSDNKTDKLITYKVDLTNRKAVEVKGIFTDKADSKITINEILYNGEPVTSGSIITLPAKSTITLTITASFPKGQKRALYKNTASLDTGQFVLESSDYFYISNTEVTLKKYITKISTTNDKR